MKRDHIENQSGFSLIEVMVSMGIMALIVYAASQSTVGFIKQLRKAERAQEVLGETQDVIRYIRRSLRNLSLSRLDQTNIFLLFQSGAPQALGPNPKTPVAAMTVDVTGWMDGGNANPFYAAAQAAFPVATKDIFLDSFLLEEYSFISQSGGLEKKTRRLVVSRCDSLDHLFNAENIKDHPSVTALYILGGMPRRPFISYDSKSRTQVNCCPASDPGCADGSLQKYFFRTYVINLDQDQKVITVEEFPKSNEKNPVIGSGFGLYFQNRTGSSVSIQTFTINNTCLITVGTPPAVCSQLTDLKSVMAASQTESDLVRLKNSSISTTISNDIVATGVIAL